MIPRPPNSKLFPYTTLFRSMATIQRINIIGSREGSRNRRRLKANQTGKKFRVGIKSKKKKNRKSGSAGMLRTSSYADSGLKKKNSTRMPQTCRGEGASGRV